jgi:dihydrofolate reductase
VSDVAATPTAPRLALVAALDRNRAIGRDNALPWHLPEDLKRFKRLTLGHPVLMGRVTAQSIGRALPGRRNLVLSRGGRAPFPGQEAFTGLDAALAAAAGAAVVYVIGGAEIYRLCLPRANALHLTEVDAAVEGANTWFPAYDPAHWRALACEAHPADERHAFGFRFVDYERVGAGPVGQGS